MSFSRLDAFARGQIVALGNEGLPPTQIARKVRKKDGTRPQLRAVQKTIAKAKAEPRWRGENAAGGPGRQPTLTGAQQKKLVDLVFKERGSKVVCIKYCRQRLPFLRNLSRWTISRALRRAGLAWLRRRCKRWVPAPAREARCTYARWLKKQTPAVLSSFAYMDGTTFYLAEGPRDALDKEHNRLGKFVWRGSSAAEGLYHDNVGPSLFAATHGRPVKVWGLVANGHLCVHVLPSGARAGESSHMNGGVFRKMVEQKTDTWLRACWRRRRPSRVRLVMDFEKCLRQDASLATLKKNGLYVVAQHPKYSPDLNAIENVWHLLRTYLEDNAPAESEGRKAFLTRLHGAVRHLNTSRRDELLDLCTNQKHRASALLKAAGARTKW